MNTETLHEVTGIILCGGNGNRLREVTNGSIPKPLVPVRDGVTLLDLAVAPLEEAGVGKLVFAAAHRADKIAEHVRNQPYAQKSTIAIDSLEGPDIAIKSAIGEGDISGPVVILHADTVLSGLDLFEAYQFHERNNANVTIVGIPAKRDRAQDTAYIISDSNHNAIARIDENEGRKSGLENPTNMSGMLIGSSEATEYIKSFDRVDPGADFLTNLSQLGSTKVYVAPEVNFANVNRPDALAALQKTLSESV
jgi:NDP-sugar pyrophosphorylase family protein